jgi:hypothetical protein
MRWAPVAVLAVLAGGLGVWRLGKAPTLDDAAFAAAYAVPLTPPEGPLAVYHLGHSLVGRDMPAMLAQLAGHDHASQLGWGASLRQHWTPEEPIPGFETENDHPKFRPAQEALASGEYGAVVLTDVVEIRDAIQHFESPVYLARWAQRAHDGNPGARVYLYETWHELTDPEGWLNRLDADLARYWEGAILRPALAREGTGAIHVIPGGQVMAAVVRAMEAGQVPGLTRREELFARLPEGGTDPIHLNDLGAYVIALTHYAVIYHRDPLGLPHRLARFDGSPADPVPDAAAAAIQAVVWRAVTGYAPSGVGKK